MMFHTPHQVRDDASGKVSVSWGSANFVPQALVFQAFSQMGAAAGVNFDPNIM
jgi:hypothetical protein